jgi:hypothetical protein
VAKSEVTVSQAEFKSGGSVMVGADVGSGGGTSVDCGTVLA